jgi:spermidine synthase
VLAGAGWLLERAGNRGTVSVAACAQAGVAALAALLAWWWPRAVPARATPAVPPPEPPAPSSRARARRALAAAFLAGGAGLVVQVAWVRRLTPAVGTTTQAFATVLAAYLLALALGTLAFGPRRGAPGGTRGSAWTLALGALPVALLPLAIAPVARFAAERAAAFAGEELDLLLLRAAAAGLVLVPSVVLGAAALSWLVREEGAAGAEGTRRSGRLLAWNTAGSAALALLTGLVWLPAVGSAAVLRGAAGLLLGAAALRAPRAVAAALGVLALGLLVQPFVRPVADAAGRDAVGAAFLPGQFGTGAAPALFFAEGRATTVVVRDREGRRELWVEGKIEASTQPTDLLHLTLLGALPMALHPAPRRAGVIGLGTGRTAGAVAAFGPERLVVFELEPEVVRAAAWFEADGAGVPARAEVVIGDARRSLAARPERFDVLTSDPIHPGVAGSALLYSREAYETARARLADGGLFCQWLPMYQLTADDLRLALRTLLATFPRTHLFQAGSDLVVVAAAHEIRVDEAALRARLAGPAGAPLAPLGLRSPGRLLALHLRDPAGVRRFAGEGPLNTDDRLLLEFRAGRAWFLHDEAANAGLLALGRTRGDALLTAAPSAAFAAEAALGRRHDEAIRAWLQRDVARAVETFDVLAAADPADRFSARMRDGLRLERLAVWIADGFREEAAAEAAALREAALDDVQRLDLAEALFALGSEAEARAIAAEIARARGWPRAHRLAAP